MKNFVVLIMCVLFSACGTGSDKKNQKTKKTMTAEVYAEEVYKIWEESILSLDKIIGNRPHHDAELEQRVAQLKEETIHKLLPYGSEHARQPENIQKTWSTKLAMKSENLIVNRAWDNTMNNCYKHYFSQDYRFASLIASFNTITQYADFRLLKKQNPAEADRLDIH